MKNQRKIQILVSSGHPLFLDGFRIVLGSHPEIQVLAEAKGLNEAVGKTLALRPDVLLLDISPQDSGVPDAIRQMTRSQPGLKIIVLSLGDSGAPGRVGATEAEPVKARTSMAELLDMIYTVGRAGRRAAPHAPPSQYGKRFKTRKVA